MSKMNNRIILGVGAVVIIDEKILLVKRGNPPFQGFWSIPGGHVEYGEKLVDAVKRELFEETRVIAEPIGILWVSEILPSSYQTYARHYVLIDFLMKPYIHSLENMCASSDAIDIGLFNIYNPPDNITPSTRYLINYLVKIIKKGKDMLYQKLIPISNNIVVW